MIHAAQTVFIRTDDPTKIVPMVTFDLVSAPKDDDEDRRSIYIYTVALEDTE